MQLSEAKRQLSQAHSSNEASKKSLQLETAKRKQLVCLTATKDSELEGLQAEVKRLTDELAISRSRAAEIAAEAEGLSSAGEEANRSKVQAEERAAAQSAEVTAAVARAEAAEAEVGALREQLSTAAGERQARRELLGGYVRAPRGTRIPICRDRSGTRHASRAYSAHRLRTPAPHTHRRASCSNGS